MVAANATGSLGRLIVTRAAQALSDEEVWRRIARPGADDADWQVAVGRWAPLVHKVAHRATGDPTAAEDVVQEVFTELVRAVRRSRVPATANVPAWLCVVATRAAYRYRRSNRKASPAEGDVSSRPAADDAPVERAEVVEVVRAEIANLPDKYRTAVLLCDITGTDRAAVARQLNVTPNTLNQRLSRARQILEAQLRRRGMTAAAVAALATAPADAADPVGLSGRVADALRTEVARLAAGGIPATWGVSVKAKVAAVAAVTVAVGCAVVGFGTPPTPSHAEPRPAARSVSAAADRTVGVEVFEVSVWRPDGKRDDNRFAGRIRKGGANVVPQRRDLFAWDVTLDAPHPCVLLHVRPDGTVRLLDPAGEGKPPEVRTAFRYPAVEAHDGVSHTLDEAGNQALVLIVLRRPADPPAPAAVPWLATSGEGLWYADPDGGVQGVELLNKLAFKPFNPDTRRPVEGLVEFFGRRANVRAVFAFGLTVRP
jgi:RNA polymerase sigma factor (sigma-70 family)